MSTINHQRVFLARASGVIGRRLIPRLVEARYVVGGMTRSADKTGSPKFPRSPSHGLTARERPDNRDGDLRVPRARSCPSQPGVAAG